MTSQRLHEMDFCRTIFMHCGLFFHCGLIYGTGHSWRVSSDETQPALSLLSNFIHHFRMEAFYLVSGFFYLLIFQKSRPNFLEDKIVRVLIPMIFIGITLNSLMNHFSYNIQYTSGWDYISKGQWLGHLWFLGNLLIYYIAAMPICKMISDNNHQLTARQFHILLMGLLLIAILGHFSAQYFQLKTFIFINFGFLVYYFCYFLMGIWAFAARAEFFQLITIGKFPMYLSIYAVMQGLPKLFPELQSSVIELLKLTSHFPLMLAAFSILCFIGRNENKVIRTFSDASYTIYLLHQPLIILFYVAIFQGINIGAYSEYMLLIGLVLLASFLLHHWFISHSVIFKFLFNGIIDKRMEIMTLPRFIALVFNRKKQGPTSK